MKKLALAAFFLVACVGFAQAQTTAKLGLYTDPSGGLNSCQMDIGIFATDSIYLYYVKGNGHDLGFGVEFKGVLSDPDAAFSPPPRWSSLFVLSQGDIDNGISLVANACMGVNQSYVWLGRISVFYGGFDTSVPFTARILEHPETGDIRITRCDPQQTIDVVRGSWFVFNGICNLAVMPTSWGAIKDLYK
jgi:hypothetical protein